MSSAPLPPGTVLHPDPSLRRRDAGRLFIGGSPLRFIRVSAAGATVVSKWLRGEAVGSGSAVNSLARRLMTAGMFQPDPPDGGIDATDLTVVIPVKDDAGGLRKTLASLPDVPVVVVDDGSAHPVPVDLSTEIKMRTTPITVVRRPSPGGPGVARQQGLALVSSPIVAFVDAGVVVEANGLTRLSRWFADPELVAVGPRVACTEADDYLSRYDVRRSPLDLGRSASRVSADSSVTYLPTACLLARTVAIERTGGFDPELRWGEDVDLIWRLLEHGDVRYDPSVVVNHPARSSLRGLIRQRIGYGSAAGPLSVRHPDRLAPVRMSGWSLACWLLVFAGRPKAALVLAAGTSVALKRKLHPVLPDSAVEAALLAGRGHWYAGKSLAGAATRVWWPITVLGAVVGLKGAAIRLITLSMMNRLIGPGSAKGDRLSDTLIGAIDDAAYGTGVWLGAIRSRSLKPLLPKLSEWPPRE